MNTVVPRGQKLVEAALGFVGVPFRLFGRDRRYGIDCVGLILCCLEEIGYQTTDLSGYRLRNSDPSPWLGEAEKSGFEKAVGQIKPGDLILTRPGPSQHHIMITENANWAIHAHAGLRRVVRQPMQIEAIALARWRLP